MISIGYVAPNRNEPAPIKGVISNGATWDQFIPIVDDAGARLDLDNYEFELAFRECNAVRLRLSTVTGEIQKTTDANGDTLRVMAAPTLLANMRGDYDCSFAAKDDTGQVFLLAAGTVTFRDVPAQFATA